MARGRHELPARAAAKRGINRLAMTAMAYTSAQAPKAAPKCQSASIPPATEPSKMAAIVEASIMPLALTSCSPEVSSPKMPYLAGE
ncbi:Uncharacterised protein [Yersinia enterocolitica]|nr:Uncharacterised protein [Yersinia enterocolitica]